VTVPGKLLIHIQKSSEELAHLTVEHIVEILTGAISARGKGSLVLSGGETPRRTYQLLGSEPLKRLVDWNKVHLYFSDERMVPPDHPESNFGMSRHEFIGQIPIPAENVHRMKGECEPAIAAREYSDELHLNYREEIPRFDCVLLGIGEDGHTASLFPGTDAVKERKSIVVALFVPRLNAWRTSLTFPVINNAREVIMLVAGKNKASIVKNIIESPKASLKIPATLVHPRDGILHWMLDSEAASLVGPGSG